MFGDRFRPTNALASGLSRRALLVASGGLAAVTVAGRPASAATSTPAPQGAMRSFLIEGAHIVTMDAALGDIEQGDILVEDGRISAIGRNLGAQADFVIDGTGRVVLPGFIDTHTHMWNAIWKNVDAGYQALTDKMGSQYKPEDSYNAVKLCAFEMLNSGITTAHAWEHNIRTREHADAEIEALLSVGMRARYSYGYYHQIPNDQQADLEGMKLARDRWNGDLITVGFATRDLENDSGWPAATKDVRRVEWEFARREKIPITQHANVTAKAAEPYFDQAGPDLLLVHGYQWNDEAVWKRFADLGVKSSMVPHNAYGIPVPFAAMTKAGIVTALSFDDIGGTGQASFLRVLNYAALLDRWSGGSLTPRQILEAATIQGARALGIDSTTGSLTKGKLADLIVIDFDTLDMAPRTRSIHASIVNSASQAEVSYVSVGGKFAKFDGKMVVAEERGVITNAEATLVGLLERSKL